MPPVAAARLTRPAACSAPAAADFTLRATARFALPSAFFASVSADRARRSTVRLAARAFFATADVARPTSRFAPAATPSAFFASVVPTSAALSLAASIASPILVSSPFLRVIVVLLSGAGGRLVAPSRRA